LKAIWDLPLEGEGPMQKLKNLIYLLSIWKDSLGQDLIEYALMAGFVAVAAAAIMPNLGQSLSQIFSMVTCTMSTIGGS
jgi:pilus assembly protein Flp/PilA